MVKPSPSGKVRQFEPQVLYRFWQNDILLYVGISQSFLSRMDQHESVKDWFKLCDHVTLEHLPTRAAVLAAETKAIKTEKPLFNVVHNTKNRKDPKRLAALSEVMDDDYFYKLPDTPAERKEFIHSLGKSVGFTRVTLDKLRVPFPPPKKWRSNLVSFGEYKKQ